MPIDPLTVMREQRDAARADCVHLAVEVELVRAELAEVRDRLATAVAIAQDAADQLAD